MVRDVTKQKEEKQSELGTYFDSVFYFYALTPSPTPSPTPT